MAVATVAGRWAEEEHVHLWQRALERLAQVPSIGGYGIWADMRRYPATLLLYSLGNAGRLAFLSCIFSTTVHLMYNEKKSAVQLLAADLLFSGNKRLMRILDGMERRFLPLNDWLHAYSSMPMKYFRIKNVTFELLMSLYSFCQAEPPIYIGRSIGAFKYRPETTQRILTEIMNLSLLGDRSPYVAANIFGATDGRMHRAAFTLEWRLAG